MPSLIEKLQKILRLEAELGYENKAVVGGLEKFLPSWVKEAQSSNISGDLIEGVVERINNYRNQDQAARTQTLNDIFRLLGTAKPSGQMADVRPKRRDVPPPPLRLRPNREPER